MDGGGGRGGACRDMLGCDWWRDGFIVLFVIIQSSEWFHLRLSSIRRVCSFNVSTPPPGYQRSDCGLQASGEDELSQPRQ